MNFSRPANETAELRRLQAAKTPPPGSGRGRATDLGTELLNFHKNVLQKRQTRMTAIVDKWVLLVPEALCEHCSLHSFARGSLTVLVDTSSHLYELRQLLLSGLEEQLLLACRAAGLRKISLRAGQID